MKLSKNLSMVISLSHLRHQKEASILKRCVLLLQCFVRAVVCARCARLLIIEIEDRNQWGHLILLGVCDGCKYSSYAETLHRVRSDFTSTGWHLHLKAKTCS